MATFASRPLFNSAQPQPNYLNQRRLLKSVQHSSETSTTSTGNEIVDSGDFKVQFDVKNFKPEEISVKVVGREVTVETKSEKKTEDTFDSRCFVRQFKIPLGYNIDDVIPTVDKEGMMTITVSRPKIVGENKERVVPVLSEPGQDQKIKKSGRWQQQ